MLIDHPIAISKDQSSDFVAAHNGVSGEPRKLDRGIYERGDFSITAVHDTALIDDNPLLNGGNCFGVCDHYQQVVETIPELTNSDRSFFVTVTHVQPEPGGTSEGWQRWGPYIGTQEPPSAWFDSEPVIEGVFVYHVYEVIERTSLH